MQGNPDAQDSKLSSSWDRERETSKTKYMSFIQKKRGANELETCGVS